MTDTANARAELAATRRFHAEQLDADREFQTRADAAFNTMGLGAAPRRQHSENRINHRARVMEGALGAVAGLDHADRRWMGFDPKSIRDETAAEQIANVVLDSATAAWTAPVGALRESVERDSGGREVRKFYGDPEGAWRPFKPNTIRLVTKWLEPHRGRPAPNAPRPVEIKMSDGTIRRPR